MLNPAVSATLSSSPSTAASKRRPVPSTGASSSHVLRTTSLTAAADGGDAAAAAAAPAGLTAVPPSSGARPDEDGPARTDSRSPTPSASGSDSCGSRDDHPGPGERIAQLERELERLRRAEAEAAAFWQAQLAWQQQQAAQAEAALRQQVLGLKERVSTATRGDGLAASDEFLGDGMTRLANGLQNWVIVHFRRAKLRPPARSSSHGRPDGPDDELARLVPMHEALRRSAKLPLLQSAVSRLLVEHVFASYYVGLSSEQAGQLSQAELFLQSFAGSQEPVNQWRALTLALVSKDATHQLQAETARVVDDVVARISSLLDAVTTTTISTSTTSTTDDAQPKNDNRENRDSRESRDQSLRTLVASAVDLSRLLVAQRAVFRVFMPDVAPHHQLLLDTSTMEDMGGGDADDDGLAQREVTCVTFPGIIKHGDATGSHLQYRNVICKARVLCALEE